MRAGDAMSLGEHLLQEIFDVRGDRAIVTGAASGIGKAIAEVLARSGAIVTLVDRDADTLEIVVKSLLAEELKVEGAVVDITDAAAVEETFDRAVERHGGLEIVIANAGGPVRGLVVDRSERVLDRYSEEAWSRGIGLNLTGAFTTVRAAARHMRPAGAGRIVVTASTAGLRPDPYTSYDYVAAKAGVANLVRQAALDLAPDGVRVNAIAPGPFKTNIGGPHGNDPEIVARWSGTVPLGRMGETDDLRGLALLLASPASAFITGAVFPIDGGALALSETN
jgi:NAD(P)-dependent dehydrogenase (short-subunit alcohol dehydrogenase family)